KHFTVYKDIETELMAFFSCNLCFENGEEKLNNIANRLKKNRVDKLHLGACALKCKEDRLKEIKKVFIDLGIDVVEGTHRSEERRVGKECMCGWLGVREN